MGLKANAVCTLLAENTVSTGQQDLHFCDTAHLTVRFLCTQKSVRGILWACPKGRPQESEHNALALSVLTGEGVTQPGTFCEAKVLVEARAFPPESKGRTRDEGENGFWGE